MASSSLNKAAAAAAAAAAVGMASYLNKAAAAAAAFLVVTDLELDRVLLWNVYLYRGAIHRPYHKYHKCTCLFSV